MERIDGDPQVLLPNFYRWLQPRERSAISARYEETANRRATPAYGLPAPEELAASKRHPDLDSALASARASIVGGARNAYVLWHSLAAGALIFFSIQFLLSGGWVSRVTGVLLLAALAPLARHKLRREREVLTLADAHLAALRNDEPEPGCPTPAASRSVLTWAPSWVVGAAAVVGLASLGMMLDDVVETRGWPQESAQLVAAEDRGDHGCGRSNEPRDLTWVSADPPADLPARFVEARSCRVATGVGDHVTMVRVVHEDGKVDVHVDPQTSYVIALVTASFMTVVVLLPLWAGVSLMRWRRR